MSEPVSPEDKERRSAIMRARFARAQKEARAAEEERLRREEAERGAERDRILELCVTGKDVLVEAGWTGVEVRHRAMFTVTGYDPQGVNHSSAGYALDELILVALAAGKPVARTPRPEPVAPSLAAVAVAPPPSPPEPVVETADATMEDRAFPLMSESLRGKFISGETFRDGHKRLTQEMREEYDRMMQLVLQQAGARVVNKETGQTATERHAELSRLKHELQELGNRMGVSNG